MSRLFNSMRRLKTRTLSPWEPMSATFGMRGLWRRLFARRRALRLPVETARPGDEYVHGTGAHRAVIQGLVEGLLNPRELRLRKRVPPRHTWIW